MLIHLTEDYETRPRFASGKIGPISTAAGVLLVLSVLLPGSAVADGYESMTTAMTFRHTQTYKVNIAGERPVTIAYHGDSPNEAIDTLETILKAGKLFLQYLDEGEHYNWDCKSYNKINVFELQRHELNDRSMMSFVQWSNWNNNNITGLYDSLVAPAGEASIFLSRSIKDPDYKNKVIAHETAHYLQDVLCVEGDVKAKEAMSMRFETYYSQRS